MASGECYACPPGKYSIVSGAETCLSCPKEGVDECPGLSIIKVSASYWRKNMTTDIISVCSNGE